MKAKTLVTLLITLMLLLNTSFADTASLPSVNFSEPGIISVCFDSQPSTYQVLMIKANGQDVVYPLIHISDSFPCQFGTGEYTATVLEHQHGDEYLPLNSWNYQLNSSTDNIFLQSIQNINWTKNAPYIQSYASSFSKTGNTQLFIKVVHDDMVKHFNYDYQKLSTVTNPYVPDNTSLYKSKVGICYDFSSYFAAVMRAYDIPCKLVKGYRTGIDSYHAWNEVYDGNTWQTVDISYDINLKEMNVVSDVYQDSSNYKRVHEY